ncbi:hypothetical protein AltI4_30540 [Alteromonas sp. I4]|nr:hypothetical protein AltI4_30540 [Alteromonas sp. I4]
MGVEGVLLQPIRLQQLAIAKGTASSDVLMIIPSLIKADFPMAFLLFGITIASEHTSAQKGK